jgi:SAM-dependent methyltransferase
VSDLDENYRKDSRARWGVQAKGWSAHAEQIGRQTMPVSVWMVDALRLQPGQEILELAAGTGEVGFLAAEQVVPGGTLISSDFAPEMITAAQARAEQLGITNVRFRQIDAEGIDQPAASLDGVLCRWGYMLMADGEAALRETRRVLKPGARVALAAWTGAAENPWASIPMAELVARGHVERPDPALPGQFAWARAGTIEEHLDAAGFTEYEVDTVDFAYTYPSVDEWLAVNRALSGMLRMALEELPADEVEDWAASVREQAIPYVQEDGSVLLPARSWVAAAAA